MKLLFSCDLVSNAKKHLQFLQDIHVFNNATFVVHCGSPPSSSTDPARSLRQPVSATEIEALRRYQYVWLPLVVTTNSPLIPPPDIAWLWHCHRLAPQQYQQYCATILHTRMVDANPPFAFASPEDDDIRIVTRTETKASSYDSVIARTKELWKEAYPNESFYLSDLSNDADFKSDMRPLIHGFDLIGSARRQTTFLWQVSGERYKCDSFLKEGVQNYEKFLNLTKAAKQMNVMLVPTYQIDLMWHTHILSSVNDYHKDCIRIINTTMYHDDSLDDREEGGVLDVSYTATQKLWKSVYQIEYQVLGGMYRGEPPPEYYHAAGTFPTTATPSPIHHNLIGLVGASSTPAAKVFSLTPPKQWVKVTEYASDGNPAFIKTYEQSRNAIKALPHRDQYVLGRIAHKTGYFHIETVEAYMILYYRMMDRLSTMKADMMADMCTCGLWKEKKKNVTNNMKEYEQLTMICETLRRQIFSPHVSSVNTIAPDKLYECAGGSCGGTVALKGGQGTFDLICVWTLRLRIELANPFFFSSIGRNTFYSDATGTW